MHQLLRQIFDVGIKRQPPPLSNKSRHFISQRLEDEVLRLFNGALAIGHVAVPGCPPAPAAIMQGILTALSATRR